MNSEKFVSAFLKFYYDAGTISSAEFQERFDSLACVAQSIQSNYIKRVIKKLEKRPKVLIK